MMIGFLVLLGSILLKKKWYDTIASTLKAIIGMLILNAGSSGLTSTFRPILAGLRDRFNLSAVVIDPYYGQNAVTEGLPEVFGVAFSSAMTLLLIAFIVNILLVRFNKLTKCRALFTTGHVQVQQAATAFWLVLFAMPALAKEGNTVLMLVVMSVLLGAYWAVGANLTIKPMQELSDGAGFCIAHQQMFGIRINYWLAEKFFSKDGKPKGRKVGEMQMPGFFSIFNENMVCTAILMVIFFGTIMAIIGKDYFVAAGSITEDYSFVYYCFTTSLNFAVYLAILQLGVRTFVTELTTSFQGIADKLLPASIPGVDCAVCFGFGDSNAVTFGFLAGLVGQIIAILALIVFKSPVIIICGFVPVFFDNATIGLVVNEKGCMKATLILCFLSGLVQVFGSALIASFSGLAEYGGYLGMWDWATVWPIITVIVKYLGWAGVIIVAVGLLAIPQLECKKEGKDAYFLMTEDWNAYKKLKGIDTGSDEDDEWAQYA
jgi:PTS system ascorbate-specific IIC component